MTPYTECIRKSTHAIYKILKIVFLFFVVTGCNIQADKNHYILAERLFADHQYSPAVEEFQKIVENNPRSALAQQAMFRIATIQYLYLERYKEALKNLRQFAILSQNEDLVFQAEKIVGEILFSKMEDYRGAIEQYRKLIEKHPKSGEKDFFLLRIARSYYGILDFDGAIEGYKKLLKEFPKSPLAVEAMYQFGNTYYTKGDCDEAIDVFRDLILSFPKTPQVALAEFGIGGCYEDMGKADQAIAVYQKLVDHYPSKSVVLAKIHRLKERQEKKRQLSGD